MLEKLAKFELENRNQENVLNSVREEMESLRNKSDLERSKVKEDGVQEKQNVEETFLRKIELMAGEARDR